MSNQIYMMSRRDAYKLAFEAVGDTHIMNDELCIRVAKMIRETAHLSYSLGYKAAQADANAAAQQEKSKPNPFAMQEVAPGMFAMTLDNPEQLFALLDALSGEREFI